MANNNNLFNFSLSIGIVSLSIALLVLGRDILMPLAIAIVSWYLINALSKFFSVKPISFLKIPSWLRLLISLIIIVVILIGLGNLIAKNISLVIEAAPTYQQNLNHLIISISNYLGLTETLSIKEITNKINFRSVASNFAAGAASITANAGLIIIYVLFLLAEQRTFSSKLLALFPEPNQQAQVKSLLGKIQSQIQTYIWIKTLMSFLTGIFCYLILFFVGLDFAIFWAFIIFLLNYIPTVGSLLGIALPSILAIIQFNSISMFLIVIISLSITQFLIGNLIEPRLMGRSLNLSPLIVIITLVVWSSIWGIAGAVLCVPITVIAMIIFSHFERTKTIAIVLSGDGKIE